MNYHFQKRNSGRFLNIFKLRDGNKAHLCTTTKRYWGDETFSASENIKLTTGFKVSSGAKFHAKIDNNLGCGSYVGCSGCSSCGKNARLEGAEVASNMVPTNSNYGSPTQLEVSIHPNPFEKVTSINYNLGSDQSIYWVLTGIDGVVLLNSPTKFYLKGKSQEDLDLSTLSSGLYFLKVNISNKLFVQKIIKE